MKRNDVFVLMPFAKKYDDIYHLGIKEPLEKMGLVCKRVDELHFTGELLGKICESIKRT